MIASLKGIILSKKPEGVIVDVNGVGYHVCVPLCSLCDIPEQGETVFLHTYTHVREDALQLFGFLTEEERKVFTVLLGINGVGPKLGLAILSGMHVQRFIEAIDSGDVSLLSTIPGLGQKTSARLVLELKGKLPALNAVGAFSSREKSAAEDAVSALINLGYKKPPSEKAVEKAVKNGVTTIEVIIREALKYLTDK
ncbi:MAG: Holliday junction branch migration protein RuvA [Nitrospiraceae bacterium]|nr:MAG: Holliday junction branch migration protein RuvA [Nitrospiraceae bacterium]